MNAHNQMKSISDIKNMYITYPHIHSLQQNEVLCLVQNSTSSPSQSQSCQTLALHKSTKQ